MDNWAGTVWGDSASESRRKRQREDARVHNSFLSTSFIGSALKNYLLTQEADNHMRGTHVMFQQLSKTDALRRSYNNARMLFMTVSKVCHQSILANELRLNMFDVDSGKICQISVRH